jgi:hypothetical protein
VVVVVERSTPTYLVVLKQRDLADRVVEGRVRLRAMPGQEPMALAVVAVVAVIMEWVEMAGMVLLLSGMQVRRLVLAGSMEPGLRLVIPFISSPR